FRWLRTQIPAKGFTAWELVLADVWKAMGWPRELEAEMSAWVDRYFATLPEKNAVRPPERRYGGLPLEEYARFSSERDAILGKMGYGLEALASFTASPPPELVELCERYGVPLRNPAGGLHARVD